MKPAQIVNSISCQNTVVIHFQVNGNDMNFFQVDNDISAFCNMLLSHHFSYYNRIQASSCRNVIIHVDVSANLF